MGYFLILMVLFAFLFSGITFFGDNNQNAPSAAGAPVAGAPATNSATSASSQVYFASSLPTATPKPSASPVNLLF